MVSVFSPGSVSALWQLQRTLYLYEEEANKTKQALNQRSVILKHSGEKRQFLASVLRAACLCMRTDFKDNRIRLEGNTSKASPTAI